MNIEDYGIIVELLTKSYIGTSGRYFNYVVTKTIPLEVFNEDDVKACIREHGVCYLQIREHGKIIKTPHLVKEEYRSALRILEKVKREALAK